MNIPCDTGIKVFVLVTLAIFGISHYRGDLCFTNTSRSIHGYQQFWFCDLDLGFVSNFLEL